MKKVTELTDEGRVVTWTPKRIRYVALPVTIVDTRWKRVKRKLVG